MTISRVSVAWQGWPGAPGVSQFYYGTALGDLPTQGNIDALRTFFNSLVGSLPAGLTISVPKTGDRINEVDGKIIGTWDVPVQPLVVNGAGAGNYAGNAGAVCHWLTPTVVAGRRVRGRTFLVPLISTAFDATGSLSTTFINTLQNAAQALVAQPDGAPTIWARPFIDPKGVKPARPGSRAQVTSFRVPDLAVSQRSRRI